MKRRRMMKNYMMNTMNRLKLKNNLQINLKDKKKLKKINSIVNNKKIKQRKRKIN